MPSLKPFFPSLSPDEQMQVLNAFNLGSDPMNAYPADMPVQYILEDFANAQSAPNSFPPFISADTQKRNGYAQFAKKALPYVLAFGSLALGNQKQPTQQPAVQPQFIPAPIAGLSSTPQRQMVQSVRPSPMKLPFSTGWGKQ